jgi:hypothetical protein
MIAIAAGIGITCLMAFLLVLAICMIGGES